MDGPTGGPASTVEVTMALPDAAVAGTWGGRTVVDRTGATIGACIQIYLDDATGLPEWAAVRMGNVSPLIPLVDATEDDGRVRVAVERDTVVRAPEVSDRQHLSTDDETRLYRHYGVAFSDDGSPTLLPVSGAPGSASGAAAGRDGEGSRPARFGEVVEGRERLVAGGLALAVISCLAVALAVFSRRSRRRRTDAG